MAAPQLSEELAQQTVDAYREHGSQQKAADATGVSRATFASRLKIAAARGLLLDHPPAMPGFRISQVTNGPNGKSIQQKPEHGDEFVVPKGHMVKGVSALVDEDGREIVKWVKTKEGVLDPLELAENLKKSFEDFKPAAKPKVAPKHANDELLTFIPCNDWHLGMYAWKPEVGSNWDLKVAEDTIGAGMDDVIYRSKPSGEAVVLVGGDLLHSDNKKNQTANSGNQLDVDGRYQKVIDAACRLMVRVVDAALDHHAKIIVRVLPGNHDEHSSVAVAYFLRAWYRKETRVLVDVDPSLFWFHRFGQVFLGATHGHTVKVAKMAGIMAARRPEDWGASKFRYSHGFHLHHAAKTQDEDNGVISETHQAPIPQDSWHFGQGYLSGRSLKAITYHRELGEVDRVTAAMLDAT
jgi:hypothetical protein